jgi:hypothetical protein
MTIAWRTNGVWIILFGWVVLFGSAAAAQAPAVDWEKQKAETLRHYRALLQIDTSAPPGNETKAVEYLKNVL